MEAQGFHVREAEEIEPSGGFSAREGNQMVLTKQRCKAVRIVIEPKAKEGQAI
jgi:hypothetical protein